MHVLFEMQVFIFTVLDFYHAERAVKLDITTFFRTKIMLTHILFTSFLIDFIHFHCECLTQFGFFYFLKKKNIFVFCYAVMRKHCCCY